MQKKVIKSVSGLDVSSMLLEFYTAAQKRAGAYAHARAQVQASADVHFTKISVTGDWSSGPPSHPEIGPQSESLAPPEAEEDVQYISGGDDDDDVVVVMMMMMIVFYILLLNSLKTKS